MLDNPQIKPLSLRKPITESTDDEYTAFANGRVGLRPQLTVTFRKVTGACHSFSYSHLYCLTTEAENAGFMAEFSLHRVFVEGRNLGELFRLLGEHRVQTVQETSERQSLALDDALPVVERIKVMPIGHPQ